MGEILLGCSGWSYDEWVGPFYPDKGANKLSFYARVFKTAEVNSTFYSLPSEGVVKGWVRHTQAGFKFSAKLPRKITHGQMLKVTPELINELNMFCDLMSPILMAEKLACLLIQCPPGLKLDLNRLESFLAILPEAYPFAVEFRHPSWLRGETYQLLERYRVAYAIIDEPLLPPEVHITSDISYVRWHGRGENPWYDYKYDRRELEDWGPKLKDLSKSVDRLYGYFNNHFHGYAVENCLQLLEILGLQTEGQMKAMERVKAFRLGERRGAGPDLAGFFS